MKRIDQRWPDGLYERVLERAGRRGVTDYTVAALELALLGETHPSQVISPAGAPVEAREAVVDRAAPKSSPLPQQQSNTRPRRSCEQCGRVVGSPTMRRCGCGGKIVP